MVRTPLLPLLSGQHSHSTIIILDSLFDGRIHSKDQKALQDVLEKLGNQRGLKHIMDPKVMWPKVCCKVISKRWLDFSLYRFPSRSMGMIVGYTQFILHGCGCRKLTD